MPRGTPEKPKQDRPGRPNKSYASQLKNMGDGTTFNQNKAEQITPDILKGQITGGEVTQGRSGNIVGGRNSSAELANLLMTGVKATEQIATSANKLAQIHDKNKSQMMADDIREAQKKLDAGKDADNKPYDKSHFAADKAAIMRKYEDQMWTKKYQDHVKDAAFQSQMQVRGYSFEELRRKYTMEEQAILNRKYEDQNQKAEDLVALREKWEPRLLKVAGENVELRDTAIGMLMGNTVQTENARFDAVNGLIKSVLGDVDPLIDNWMEETARAGEIPESFNGRYLSFLEYLQANDKVLELFEGAPSEDVQARLMEQVEEHFAGKKSQIDKFAQRRRNETLFKHANQYGQEIESIAATRREDPNQSYDYVTAQGIYIDRVATLVAEDRMGDFDLQLMAPLASVRLTLAQNLPGDVEENAEMFNAELEAALDEKGVSAEVRKKIIDDMRAVPLVDDSGVGRAVQQLIDEKAFVENPESQGGGARVNPQVFRRTAEALENVQTTSTERLYMSQDQLDDTRAISSQYVSLRLPDILEDYAGQDLFALSDKMQSAIRMPLVEFGMRWALHEDKTSKDTVDSVIRDLGIEDPAVIQKIKFLAEGVKKNPVLARAREASKWAREGLNGEAYSHSDHAEALREFNSSINEENGFARSADNEYTFDLKLPPSLVGESLDAYRKGGDQFSDFLGNELKTDGNIPQTREETDARIDLLRGTLAWERVMEDKDPDINAQARASVRVAFGLDFNDRDSRRVAELMKAISRGGEHVHEYRNEIDQIVQSSRLMRGLPWGGAATAMDPDIFEKWVDNLDSDAQTFYRDIYLNRGNVPVPKIMKDLRFPDQQTKMYVLGMLNNVSGDLSLEDIHEVFTAAGLEIEMQTGEDLVGASGNMKKFYRLVPSEATRAEKSRGIYLSQWGVKSAVNGPDEMVSTSLRDTVLRDFKTSDETREDAINRQNEAIDVEMGGNGRTFKRLLDFDWSKVSQVIGKTSIDGDGRLSSGIDYITRYRNANPKHQTELDRHLDQFNRQLMRIRDDQGNPVHAPWNHDMMAMVARGLEDPAQGVTKNDLIQIAIHFSESGVPSREIEQWDAYEEYKILPTENGARVVYYSGGEAYSMDMPWISAGFNMNGGNSLDANGVTFLSVDDISDRQAEYDERIADAQAKKADELPPTRGIAASLRSEAGQITFGQHREDDIIPGLLEDPDEAVRKLIEEQRRREEEKSN